MASFNINEYPPNVVLLGGGGGASTLAGGIVQFMPEATTTVVVCMSDDGSSTGRLSRQFDTMPAGDVRRNIGSVAATHAIEKIVNRRFASNSLDSLNDALNIMDSVLYTDTRNYSRQRVQAALGQARHIGLQVEGGLKGHTFGNLLLTGLAVERGFDTAAKEVSSLVDARATVVPVTTTQHSLVMQDGSRTINGEHAIDTHAIQNPGQVSIELVPSNGYQDMPVEASEQAVQAIRHADLVIVSPGSPYTSILPVLKTGGVGHALQEQARHGGQVAVITNLENQNHDTDGWRAADYADLFASYMGTRCINAVVYNSNQAAMPDPSRAVRHKPRDIIDLDTKFIGADLVGAAAEKDPNDTTKRSDVYHNVEALVGIFYEASVPAARQRQLASA
jgi:uncharacterized cofD-like protein